MVRHMKRTIYLLVIAAALASGCASTEPVATSATGICVVRGAPQGRPLVTRPETARAIFLAVEADFFPDANKTEFPVVEVERDGEGWIAFRTRDRSVNAGGPIVVQKGGSQLEIRIDGCSGAVSDAHYSE